MDTSVETILGDKFLEILDKHGNPKWAVDELEYLVFVRNYERLLETNEDTTRHYMSALRKIYGEKEN